MDTQTLLESELQGSVRFFLDYTNLDPASSGYGLTADCTKNPAVASIACAGFALTAWVIAAERGYLPRSQARDMARRTMRTLQRSVAHHRGFLAHFLHIDSGERYRKCECSTIDTALCLNGVITAAAYFHEDAETADLARELLERVDWGLLVFRRGQRALFRMAYNPDRDGDYVGDRPGLIGQWSMAAEQKMMYLQAATRLDPALAGELYHGFSRDIGYFDGQPIIINPGGNLFAYQFTEAWLDTARYRDPDGVDWFNNTRLAALATRSFCIENSSRYRTYHARSWGLSAGDSPSGYSVFGSTPCLGAPHHNGTVSIYAAVASLPFVPEAALEMMHYLYDHQPRTWGPYGFYDAYNLDVSPPWYSEAIYGIDKGCSMIMIENYLTGLIWEVYTASPWINSALQVLGFREQRGGLR